MSSTEKKIAKHSFLLPTLFIALLWLIAIIDHLLDVNLNVLGVYPRTAKGLVGIITMPLVHSGFKHLFANTIPLLVMAAALIYFYRSLSYKVFFLIWIISGVCVWVGGRASYHIGASGIVYGLAAFLFISGIIRRYPRLAAISLVVVFLYGGMIWGVLPIWPAISWEGHLFGGLAGVACAILFRHEGPKRPIYSWEIDDEDAEGGNFDPLEKTDPKSEDDLSTTSKYYLSENSSISVKEMKNQKKS